MTIYVGRVLRFVRDSFKLAIVIEYPIRGDRTRVRVALWRANTKRWTGARIISATTLREVERVNCTAPQRAALSAAIETVNRQHQIDTPNMSWFGIKASAGPVPW